MPPNTFEHLRTPVLFQHRPAWIGKMQTELKGVPEFRPTEEEFADPYAYIRSIAAEGAKFVPCLPSASARAVCIARAH
jgi:hypothetical protein